MWIEGCIITGVMSSLPDLSGSQRLIGFAMPEWMVTPVPRAYVPIQIPDTDPLASCMPADVNFFQANIAFQTLLAKGVEIDGKAAENVGKRGLSRQQYREHYWFTYLEQLSDQELKDILWAARASSGYAMTMELYQNLPDKHSTLARMTAEDVELFTRIDRFLAISISIEIAEEVTKLKKQKKKIPPQQILEEVLMKKGIDIQTLKVLLALAKKTPLFTKHKTALLPLQKLL